MIDRLFKRFTRGHLHSLLIGITIADAFIFLPRVLEALAEPMLHADWREYLTASILLSAGQGHLIYSAQEFPLLQREMGMDIALFYYYHPSFLLFALPFASLRPSVSYGLWMVSNLSLLVLAISQLRTCLPKSDRLTFALLAAVQLPAWVALHLGQASFFLLLGQTLAVVGWRERNDRKAALGLVILTIKPQLLIPWLALLLLRREWRKMAYLAAGCVAIFATSVALVGVRGIVAWIQLLLAEQTRMNYPWSHSVMGLLTSLTHSSNPLFEYLLVVALVIATSMLVLGRAFANHPASAEPIALAATALASTLLANHLLIYDLTLWIVPIALGWRIVQPTVGRILVVAAITAPYLSIISPPFVVPTVIVQAAALVVLLLMAARLSTDGSTQLDTQPRLL